MRRREACGLMLPTTKQGGSARGTNILIAHTVQVARFYGKVLRNVLSRAGSFCLKLKNFTVSTVGQYLKSSKFSKKNHG